MAGVYGELCSFVLAHRPCLGSRFADADQPTATGYRLVVRCGCGAELPVLGDSGGCRRGSTADGADSLVGQC